MTTPAPPRSDSRRVLPSESEPLARGFVDFIGGAPGRHALIGRARWWTPLRVLLAVASVFLSLGWMQKANCLRTAYDSSQPYTDWSGQPQYTSACYSDIVVLYKARGLDQGIFPYAYTWMEGSTSRFMEYPVVTGLFQYLAAVLTNPAEMFVNFYALRKVSQTTINFGVNAALLSLCWLVACALVYFMSGRRPWDVVLMVASPLIIVHAFTNWDVLAVMFAMAGLYLWSRRRPAWAGAALGLGIAAKLWPIFILGALILLCMRSRSWNALSTVCGATVLSWLAVNAPIYLMYPYAWGEFFRLNSSRGWEGSTIYAVIAHATGNDAWNGTTPSKAVVGVELLNVITFALLVALLCALAFVVLTVKERPRVAEVAFLAVFAFMLTSKVWSPQYSIWLVPLLVLALPRWRLVFSWAALEAVYWYVRMWQFLGDGKGAPDWLADSLTVVRLGLLVAMSVLIIRQMYGRSVDPVRAAHEGRDPLSGALRGKASGNFPTPALTRQAKEREAVQ